VSRVRDIAYDNLVKFSKATHASYIDLHWLEVALGQAGYTPEMEVGDEQEWDIEIFIEGFVLGFEAHK